MCTYVCGGGVRPQDGVCQWKKTSTKSNPLSKSDSFVLITIVILYCTGIINMFLYVVVLVI